jgi:hypothetical protein
VRANEKANENVFERSEKEKIIEKNGKRERKQRAEERKVSHGKGVSKIWDKVSAVW